MSILNNTQVVDRTEAINYVKPVPTLIGSLGLFKPANVGTNTIQFDVKDTVFNILSDKQRNTTSKNTMPAAGYKVLTLPVPHYPIENSLTYAELAGVRGFGIDTETSIEKAVADELEAQAQRHDIHNEYLRASMLINGVVPTTFYGSINVATEFGVARPTEVISLANGVLTGMTSATNKAKKGYKGTAPIRGYVVLCGATFFNSIITSPEVKAAYANSQANGNPLRNELGVALDGYTVFRYGNVDFILYTDEFTNEAGTVSILNAAQGVLFPRTVIGSEWYGPVSKLSGIGASGAKRFASSYRDPKDRFVDVESEQNTLVLTTQFGSTVLLTTTA